MKGKHVTGDAGRTGVPGEEAARGNPQPSVGPGDFRRQLDRMLGIWVPFMVLPLAHYILFSTPHGGPAFSSR